MELKRSKNLLATMSYIEELLYNLHACKLAPNCHDYKAQRSWAKVELQYRVNPQSGQWWTLLHDHTPRCTVDQPYETRTNG